MLAPQAAKTGGIAMRFFHVTILTAAFANSTLAAPPATGKKPGTDRYHRDSVVDPYRWLEDGKAKEVQQWSEAQNAHARAYLDKLPGRDKLRERVKELIAARTITHTALQWRGGKLF